MNRSASEEPQKKSNPWVAALKFIFAAVLIAWFIYTGKLDLKLLFSLLDPTYLSVCALMVLANIAINNYRWLVLLRGQGFDSNFRSTLSLSLIGLFFNYAMPGGVGGDLVKGYYLIKDHPERKMAAAASVVMDRLIGFFVMLGFSIVSLVLNLELIFSRRELALFGFSALAIFGVFTLIFGVAFSRRAKRGFEIIFKKLPGGRTLEKLYDVVHSYRGAKRAFYLSMALSFVSQCIIFGVFMIVGHALGQTQIPLGAYLFVIPLGMIAMSLPISPAGVGVGQAAFMILFNLYLGYETQVGVTAITYYQLILFFWGLFGAVAYFRRKRPVVAGATS